MSGTYTEPAGPVSEVEQEPQCPADRVPRLRRCDAQPMKEPSVRDRLHVLALGVADDFEPGRSRLQLDVRRKPSAGGGARHDDHDTARAVVQLVGGHDDRRSTTRVLTADGLTEVDEPDLAPSRTHGHPPGAAPPKPITVGLFARSARFTDSPWPLAASTDGSSCGSAP